MPILDKIKEAEVLAEEIRVNAKKEVSLMLEEAAKENSEATKTWMRGTVRTVQTFPKIRKLKKRKKVWKKELEENSINIHEYSFFS